MAVAWRRFAAITIAPFVAIEACAGPVARHRPPSTARENRVREPPFGRDENRARGRIVLGLRQQIRGNPLGSAARPTRTTISLGPACRSIAQSAETSALAAATQALPGPTILSTRAIDAVPYAERRDGLRAADGEDFRRARLERRREHDRRGTRTDDDDLAHARDARGHDGHQQRGRQRISSAWHVAAHARERLDALFDAHARRGVDDEPARHLLCGHALKIPAPRAAGPGALCIGVCSQPARSPAGPMRNLSRTVEPSLLRSAAAFPSKRAVHSTRAASPRRRTSPMIRAASRSTSGSRAASRAASRAIARRFGGLDDAHHSTILFSGYSTMP